MPAEQAYQERVERLQKTVALGRADRVPFLPKTGAFVASAYGLNQYDMMRDLRNLIPCLKQYLTEFPPDVVMPACNCPFDLHTLLDSRYIRLPGPDYGLPLDSGFQYVDGTYLEDDELDEFLLDPTHVMLTKVMPRKYKALEALSGFYAREAFDTAAVMEFAALAQPELRAAFETMLQAGRACAEHHRQNMQVNQFVREMGFPSWDGTVLTPFDAYADSLRGLVQAAMDIKLEPEKTLEVIERIEQLNIDRTIDQVAARGAKLVFIPLHAGGDEFMSREDYATFYWPGLKRIIEKLVAHDITPYIFCEGKYSTRLEFLKDVPPGKVIYMFEQIDIVKTKRELEGVACVCGNFPTALLVSGTPAQVADETKRMLDDCAGGGGFIMDCSIIIDSCKKENFAAWYETTMTYGTY